MDKVCSFVESQMYGICGVLKSDGTAVFFVIDLLHS